MSSRRCRLVRVWWAAPCAARAVGLTLLVALGVGVGSGAEAQAVLRQDTLALAPGTSAQLAPGLVPGTVRVARYTGEAFVPLGADAFVVSPDGRLTLVPPDTALAVLAVAYRILAPPAVARLRLPSADSLRAAERAARDSLGGARAGPIDAPGTAALPVANPLRTTGSITRGVVAGTARDAAVTSGLRLELAGEVAPGVTLRGALTDENTPVLPEGTTQQLSDLDRVYVEVQSARVRARLGDVDLTLPGTAFAPITRQVQGASVDVRLPARGIVAGGRVLGAASATRGTFRSQTLVPIESVQGPYRLQGRAGEAFVVVVPGSERVTWDGLPLTRGQAADYTIDYGTGEITFTPLRLVTQERRITVDFEYTVGGLTRTLTAAGAEVGLWPGATGVARATLGVRVLREADATSFAAELGLTPTDLAAIAAAGDRDVLVPGEERVPFDAASPFVLYTRRDTLVAGQTVRIFVPAEAASAEVFRVRFTRLGEGRGDYRRGARAQNGIVYDYVGPGRGDSVPFRLLPRPASRSIADVRLGLQPLPGVEAWGEWARSVDDANTLSTVGDGDDGGAAWEAGLRLAERTLAGGQLDGWLRYRDRSDRYRPLDRVREVDFNRRWNLARAGTPLGLGLDSLGERSGEARLAWTRAGVGGVAAEGGRLGIGGVTSDRLGASATLGAPGQGAPGGLPWLDARLETARTEGTSPLAAVLGTGVFDRQSVTAGRSVGRVTPTLALERERREQGGTALDSLAGLASSYRFLALRPGVAVTFPVGTAEATAEWRREAEPLGPIGTSGPLVDAARVLTVETSASVRSGGSASGDARLAYRRRRYDDAFRQLGRQDAESVALRLSGRAAPLRRAVEVQTVYDALTERTPLLQETYVLVGPDLGEFVWRDGGGEPRTGEPDGVAQLDEFFPETTPLEGTYLRTFVPSQELFPTVGVSLGGRLGLHPGRLVPDASPLASVLRAVVLRTTLNVQEQTRSRDVLGVLLLRPGVLQQPGESGTVRGRFRIEQEAVLLPDRRDRGGRLGLDHLTSTSQLAAGRERRLAQTLRAEAYGPLGGHLAVRLEVAAERRRTLSETFASRTYDLRGLRAEPRLTWTPAEAVSLSLGALIADRTDALAPASRPSGAFIVRVPVEGRWTVSRRVVVVGRVERSGVTLRGVDAGGLALYELTEGRGAGTSYLWGADLQASLTDRLRATLVYDGRAPDGAPTVQTVRAQVSALF